MQKLYILFIVLFNIVQLSAQPTIGYQLVTTGLSAPVDIVNAGDSRLFIVEQAGRIKIWNGSSILGTSFLDITSITNYSGEMGLLSVAFHPDYANNRYFFVYYNGLNGNINLARYRTKETNSNEADNTSGVILLSIPKPFSNHNGGKLNFGADGFLYFATGDGGSGGDPNNFAQTGSSYLGKMLRIDVNNFANPPYYTAPPNNPYLADPIIKKEIIGFGLRNPWRWSFDKQTGDMWIADVGQGVIEEVNFVPPSELNNNNYGWRCYEGTQPYNTTGCNAANTYRAPIFEYGHNNTTGGYSITGGYVYRGTEYPFLQGYYIVTDYVSRNNWLIRPNAASGWVSYQNPTKAPTNISGFGEATDGTLYALGLSNGAMYKITAVNPLPLKLISFSGRIVGNQHQLNWQVNTQEKGDAFIIEASNNNVNFESIQTTLVTETKSTANYSFSVSATANQTKFYRIKLLNKDGSFKYSSIIQLNQSTKSTTRVVFNGMYVAISSTIAIQQIQITDALGRIVYRKMVANENSLNIAASDLPKGLLLIQLQQNNQLATYKLLNQ